MICYNKLWLMMKQDNKSKTEQRKAAGLGTSTFAKLTRNEMASLDVLVRLCGVFRCQISDICTTEEERR